MFNILTVGLCVYVGSAPPERKAPGSRGESKSRRKTMHRVPYFRYFGPTAIAPGFKAMVVSIQRNSIAYRHPYMQEAESAGKRLSKALVDDISISTTVKGNEKKFPLCFFPSRKFDDEC